MRVLSWNVNGALPNGWPDRARKQIEFLKRYDPQPDIILLQEVNAHQRELWWEIIRTELGYEGIADTLEWAHELGESSVQPHQDISHTNGNLTAVRDADAIQKKPLQLLEGAYEDADVKHLSTHYPEKILVTECAIDGHEIEVWNVRAVPGSMKGEEKIKILETVFDRLIQCEKHPRILGGDFNTPDDELPDGQAVVDVWDKAPEIRKRWMSAELNILKGLGNVGMVDTFRYCHGYDVPDVPDTNFKDSRKEVDVPDTSFKNSRFDHIFASEALQPTDCRYDHKAYETFDGENEYSDHAPIVATFNPKHSN